MSIWQPKSHNLLAFGGSSVNPPTGPFVTQNSAIYHDISDIDSSAWTVNFNLDAVKTAVVTPNAGGSGVHDFNPGGFADVYREYSFVAQAGSSASTFTCRAKNRPSESGKKIAICIYSGDGATRLSTTVVTLTGTLTVYTVNFATTPGTKYRARVTNASGTGADASAGAYLGDVGVTCAGATGIFAGTYYRIHLDGSLWHRNLQTYTYGAYGAGYWPVHTDEGKEVSPFARLRFNTDVSQIILEQGGNAATTILIPGSGAAMRVNGNTWSDHNLAHDGLQHTAISIPSTGVRAVELFAQGRNGIASGWTGTLYNALFVAGNLDMVPPDSPANVIAWMGDSISCDFSASPGQQYAYNGPLLETLSNRPVVNNASGGTTVFVWADTIHGYEAVDMLLMMNPSDIVLAWGTNDWQQSVGGSINRAQYITSLGTYFVDRIHALAPTVRVWISGILWKTSFELGGVSYPYDAQGYTLDDWRVTMPKILSERASPSWLRGIHTKTFVNQGLDPSTNPHFVGQGAWTTYSPVHPNNSGHGAMATKMASLLSGPSPKLNIGGTNTVPRGGTINFTASGGSGSGYTYYMGQQYSGSAAGGSVNASTGVYTAPGVTGIDTVVLEDSQNQFTAIDITVT